MGISRLERIFDEGLACLRKEPHRRYATAQALADDLRRFLAHEPIRARPIGLPERLAKWARHHPAVAARDARLARFARSEPIPPRAWPRRRVRRHVQRKSLPR